MINKIVKDGIDCPGGDNELRKLQLRELAEFNGTLIGSEITHCRNCGSNDHRHWECHEQKNVTNNIICSRCGGVGHLDMDCRYDGEKIVTAEEKCKLDEEYQSLMNELGVASTDRSIPSILALPSSIVAELPWASNLGRSIMGGNGNVGISQLALPPGIQPTMSNMPSAQNPYMMPQIVIPPPHMPYMPAMHQMVASNLPIQPHTYWKPMPLPPTYTSNPQNVISPPCGQYPTIQAPPPPPPPSRSIENSFIPPPPPLEP